MDIKQSYNNEIVLYGDPFIYCITTFLNINDFYNLYIVNKKYHMLINKQKIISRIIIKNINNRFKEIFKDNMNYFDEFKAFLKKGKCVITGSFILECILEQNYSNTIDIYVLHEHHHMQEYPNFLYKKNDWFYNINDCEFIYNNTVFNIIGFNDTQNCFKSFIDKKYYIDIFKNIYLINKNNKEKVITYYTNDIFTKNTNINLDIIDIKTYNYFKNIGFNFINLNYEDILNNSSCKIIFNNDSNILDNIYTQYYSKDDLKQSILKIRKINEYTNKIIYDIIDGDVSYLEETFINCNNFYLHSTNKKPIKSRINNHKIEIYKSDIIDCNNNCLLRLLSPIPQHFHIKKIILVICKK